MELPKYYELYNLLLGVIKDGQVYSISEIREQIASTLNLSEEDLAKKLPSGKQTVFNNRVAWAKSYLKKAGLVTSPQRGHFQITSEGRSILESGLPITNELLAQKYPEFAGFIKREEKENLILPLEQEMEETPEETFERMYQTINEELAEDLLTEIMNQSPAFFENVVVDLLKSMGYGDGFVTKASGDDGIDGVIHEDKLGFNLIYIQAKRWNPSTTVGKPEIQKFAGAMMGPPRIEKGLFITTAKFSQGAKSFADAQHIILVDGQKLTDLMIEYNLGVSPQKTYFLKRIDSDYFSENL